MCPDNTMRAEPIRHGHQSSDNTAGPASESPRCSEERHLPNQRRVDAGYTCPTRGSRPHGIRPHTTSVTRSFALVALLTLVGHHAQAQTTARVSATGRPCVGQTAQILIIGTCHVENPGFDAVNLDADDVLLPRR